MKDRPGILTPRSVTWGGMVANLALAAGKVTVGGAFGSQALVADGFHSASDTVTDLAVLAGLRISDKPADQEHHYGHAKINSLVAIFVAVMLIAAAGWIVYESVISIQAETAEVISLAPLLVALVSIPVKEGLYQVTKIVGERTGNMSLKANAWHHRTDAFTSVAAAVGIGAAYIGGSEWAFLDEATAVALAGFLLIVAGRIVVSSAAELMDRAPSEATLNCIRRTVANTPGVRNFHAIRARQIDGKVAMDIHIQVDPDLTVRAGHDIATRVQRSLVGADRCGVREAVVHIEPDEAEEGAAGG